MDDELKNDLKTQFESLPKELQKAISSVNLTEKLQQITKNNNLLIDQAGSIQTETYLVLLGLEPVDDYMSNLVKNAGLDKNTALKVAHDADDLIFKNVRENLKTVSQQMMLEENAEIANKGNIPQHDEVLSGIENPSEIKEKENSISVSALPSNKPEETAPEYVPFNKGIEIRKEMSPEIEPNMLPATAMKPATPKMYSESVPPVANIVESKMTSEVALPKKEIVIEEKNKIPEKKSPGGDDPYREPIQ